MAFLDADGGNLARFQLTGTAAPQPEPQAAGSPYDTNIPGAAIYGQMALAAKKAYQNALARVNQKRQGLLRAKGFAGDISDDGTVSNVRVDPSSVYGEFQLLNRDQAFRDQAARNAGISRGLGAGGGLAAQQRNQARFGFGAEDAQLGTSLVEGLAGFQDEQTQAAYARDSALYQSELEAARSSIQGEDFNPADLSGLDVPAYGQVPAGGLNPFTKAVAPKPKAKKPLKTNYNPLAYVPGGATKKVAKAIQTKGRR